MSFIFWMQKPDSSGSVTMPLLFGRAPIVGLPGYPLPAQQHREMAMFRIFGLARLTMDGQLLPALPVLQLVSFGTLRTPAILGLIVIVSNLATPHRCVEHLRLSA